MEFSGPYTIEEAILLDTGITHFLVLDVEGNPLVEAYDRETAQEVIDRLEEYQRLIENIKDD